MPEGPGVRVDTGVGEGDHVPPDYDNLVAKIMVHAGDRDAAIDRLRRALDETEIAGIQTTLPFHRFVARHPGFLEANLSTDWVADSWDGPTARAAVIETAAGAAAAATLVATNPAIGDGPATSPPASGWAVAARADAVDRWPR
jgi:acetyl-CoA carboxylase biotin carboxylase subunit